MRIDVHTHVWPDRIASIALDSMTRDLGFEAVAANTVDSLKAHMRESGVDKSVVLGLVERADQVKRANDWLISIQDEMVVPFGAIHPGLEDKADEVRRLREGGIKGIKLHPVVNSFYPDDPRMFPVYEELGEDMVLEIHSGRFPGTDPAAPVYAAPERIMNVVERFPRLKVIALHLGGFYMLDEAERELLGRGERVYRHHLAAVAERNSPGNPIRHHQQARGPPCMLRHRLPPGQPSSRRGIHRNPGIAQCCHGGHPR